MAIDTESYYRTYGPMVLRRCRKLLGDDERARDAMHDTFVNLLQHQERLTGEGPSSLLFRIATNVCLNQIRGEGRRPATPDAELVQRIADASDAESFAAARSVLARLFGSEPVSSQAIAVLHLVDGMTHEEVAREVGMSVSGVRKRLRNLRSRLAELEEK